jgi:hypothetical protein
MAVIKTQGNFDFLYPQTETYKEIWCVLKSGETVKVNFNDLQITYPGSVLVAIVYKNQPPKKEYVSLKRIVHQKETDKEYLVFMEKEVKKIEQKRKNELKQKQKEKKDRRKMTA